VAALVTTKRLIHDDHKTVTFYIFLSYYYYHLFFSAFLFATTCLSAPNDWVGLILKLTQKSYYHDVDDGGGE
jgi:hypothetical protein